MSCEGKEKNREQIRRDDGEVGLGAKIRCWGGGGRGLLVEGRSELLLERRRRTAGAGGGGGGGQEKESRWNWEGESSLRVNAVG